jgi:DivIVA domain-containing protein
MEWFIAVVAIAALGVAAMVAAGGVGEMSSEPVYDTYRQQLPSGPLHAEDIRRARFGLALRGYAMNQVDDLLERLAREVAERDARIAELTGAHQDAAPHSPPQPGEAR